MPIDAFRLENFMAFENTGWIELRKINLLLGRNSSGKTAIIRALRLLKQSHEANNNNQPLVFKAKGGVDVGFFNTILHQKPRLRERENIQTEKALPEPITFSFRGAADLNELEELSFISKNLAIPLSAETVKFEVGLSYRWFGERVHLTDLSAKVFQQGDLPNPVLVYQLDESGDYGITSLIASGNAELKGLLNFQGTEHLLPDVIIEKSDDKLNEEQRNTARAGVSFWKVCKHEIDQFLRSITYVAPIRPRPQRSYIIDDEFAQRWEQDGLKFYLDYLTETIDEDQYKKLNYWLDEIGLGTTLTPENLLERPAGDLRFVIALKLKELSKAYEFDERNLADVGYGASQVIPVIVQCALAPPNSLVIIEEPELHLHPAAQANIADLLIDSINEREPIKMTKPDSPQEKRSKKTVKIEEPTEPVGILMSRRFLIETHSETLFFRLRVELAKTSARYPDLVKRVPETENKFVDLRITPDALIGFHIDRDRSTGNSAIGRLLFDKKGEFKEIDTPNKPFGDFFGQDFKEQAALDVAASEIKE